MHKFDQNAKRRKGRESEGSRREGKKIRKTMEKEKEGEKARRSKGKRERKSSTREGKSNCLDNSEELAVIIPFTNSLVFR